MWKKLARGCGSWDHHLPSRGPRPVSATYMTFDVGGWRFGLAPVISTVDETASAFLARYTVRMLDQTVWGSFVLKDPPTAEARLALCD